MHAMADMFAQSMGMSGMPSSDDASKKIRKPYTITKARESWTEQEHDKFLEALQLFDRDWKKIEAFVASKTVIQIRSHAQKYFQKVQKNGTGEHVPPPRPKRKSAQPYPQKASKALPEAGVMGRTMNSQPTQSEPCFRRSNFPSSSMGSSSGSWQQHHSMPPVGQVTPDLRGDFPGGAVKPTPDFAEVYKFIGKVFDLDANDHLKKMKEMAPIDREAVLLLMRNLTINLSNPEFEEEQLSLLPANVDPSELRRIGPEYHMPVSGPSAAQAGSDGGDDDTAVSGQPESNQLSECPDSDAQLDSNHQTRGMPSYSMWATDETLQHGHLQDSARGFVGSVQPINSYPPLVSPRPLDMSSLARHRMMGAYSHPHLGAFNGGMGYAMPVPALTAGVESHLDGWMC